MSHLRTARWAESALAWEYPVIPWVMLLESSRPTLLELVPEPCQQSRTMSVAVVMYDSFVTSCTFSCQCHTSVFQEVGEKLRSIGREFGVTTGRPRRCGWLDLAVVKYTAMINGFTA